MTADPIEMTPERLARAIVAAYFKGDRELYLDLWEEVGSRNSSKNRLFDRVNEAIARIESDRS